MKTLPRPVAVLALLLALPAFAQTRPEAQAGPVQTQTSTIQLFNCPRNPLTNERDCVAHRFSFDHPGPGTGFDSESGISNNMMSVGPGLSVGNMGGWSVTHMYLDHLNVATRGITQGRNLFVQKHAVGDTMGTYDLIGSDGGSTALSDEAIKGYGVDVFENEGYFHGIVSSTTGTGDIRPELSFISGNNWTTDGAPLLDITAGKIFGHITGQQSALPQSSYLHIFPVDNDLPVSKAWGVCEVAIPIHDRVQTNAPFTCDVLVKTGKFEAKGTVCVTGPNYPEQAPISYAGPVIDGRQRITIAVRNPNGAYSSILQGGICGQYISFDANLATSGYRSAYYAFGALDPHHLIYGFLLKGGLNDGVLPGRGSEAEQFGVAGLNGYHLYPGCEVISNQSMGANPVCEPNSVPWSVADTIEAPHNPGVNLTGLFTDVLQNTPSNGWLSSGEFVSMHGYGVAGATFMAYRTRNGNPNSFYKPFGGALEGPDFFRVEGYFRNGILFSDPPEVMIHMEANHSNPKGILTLFALPGGEIKWDPTTGTLITKIAGVNSQPAPAASRSLHGLTGRIGGEMLAMGSCASGTATIPGAFNTMVPVTVASTTGAPGFSQNGAFQVSAQVTSQNIVTVNVCALLPGIPRASTYIVALQ